MTIPDIFVLARSGCRIARRIAEISGGRVFGLAGRTSDVDETFEDTRKALQAAFRKGSPIIAVMASGAVIRLLAPLLADKQSEPPIICVSEDGESIVPLMGGHHGANQIARFLAESLGGHPAITTAGDVRFGVALDEPPAGYRLAEPGRAKRVMADLLAGKQLRYCAGSARAFWLEASEIPFADDGTLGLFVGEVATPPGDCDLHIVPANVALGMGCERGTPMGEIARLARGAIAKAGLHPYSIAGLFSVDLKADETGLIDFSDELGVPFRTFSVEVLEALTPRLANPSQIVYREIGCHGVAESAALAAAGENGVLIAEKQKSTRATFALARAERPINMDKTGKPRGHLSVVGIGPGNQGWRSPEVSALVNSASDLVGYSLYLDLLGPLCTGKTRHDFDLGREEDRVRHAMELAGDGRNVALVCSGDAGIYAMAALVFEVLDKGDLPDAAKRISIEVSPGISALQAAAARAGAPLGHDFCTISLSDLLTPWEAIEKRIKAAAEGDFVIAFYNPVSRRRRTQLAHAKEVLLNHRPDDTPVILATSLGRDGETVRVVPLGQLQVDDVDMLTVVIVGSSQTTTVETGEGRSWVYTPRGYAAKEGSGLETKA